jgi:SHAQKYF class myb-like DNA-binding protein
MTITSSVLSDLLTDGQQPIRISPPTPRSPAAANRSSYATRNYLTLDALRRKRKNLWSPEEHERFLQGLEQFPKGPWRLIADHVATKNTRQTMTHAQKYRQKILRRKKKVEALASGSSRRNSPRSPAQSHQTSTPSSPASSDASVTMSKTETVSASSPTTADCDPFADDLSLLSSFLDELEPLDVMCDSFEEGTPVSELEQTPRAWNEFAWGEMLAWPVVHQLQL